MPTRSPGPGHIRRVHWSLLSSLGGRQILGSIQVTSRELVAEAKTLSMAAKLVGKLHGLPGGGLHLQGSRWMGMQDCRSAERLARGIGLGRMESCRSQ
jgi:hypothetical protein